MCIVKYYYLEVAQPKQREGGGPTMLGFMPHPQNTALL